MLKPKSGEYNPYFDNYIQLVEAGDFMMRLNENTALTADFFTNIPPSKHDWRYGPDKWTIKQILIHIIDAERVFAYRLLVTARGDNQTNLLPFDDESYVQNSRVENRTLTALIEEFLIVRKSTTVLFEQLSEEQSQFEGQSGQYKITPRALGYIIIGHPLHHIQTIKVRYLDV